MEFVRTWLCCETRDDPEILREIASVRRHPDNLAEQCVEYNHDPVERHVTTVAPVAVYMDNDFHNPLYVRPAQPTPPEHGMPLDIDTKDALDLLPSGSLMANTVVTTTPDPATFLNDEAPSKVYVLKQDVVEVARHRRLPHKNKGNYIAVMVDGYKTRLGCPAPTAANKLMVRRMAYNDMIKHGLRPCHTRGVIEQIIAGVFVPDEYDLLSAKMLASNRVNGLREEVMDAAPLNVWQRLARVCAPRPEGAAVEGRGRGLGPSP